MEASPKGKAMTRTAWNKGINSRKTDRAFVLISEGLTPYAAARKVGISLSTVYRARNRAGLTAKKIGPE